jgi:ZIP family zinc transporter
MQEYGVAFGLTLFAGMATGIGSVIAFAAARTNYRFLALSTGFSGGVMLYVSFVEIFPKGAAALTAVYGATPAHWINAAAFFAGMLLIGVIDNLIPAAQNPHETHTESETATLHRPAVHLPGAAEGESPGPGGRPGPAAGGQGKLLRLGLFTALAITIHNFPEGLATFLAALQDPRLGLAIAVAIALHNIPEGISVSVPIFYATGNRRKAFAYSLLSGLAEPIGAAIAYLALSFLVGGVSGMLVSQVTGMLFAAVAGIMVYISLDELLPASRAYGKGHDTIFGVVGGMAVMALSLLAMK